MQQEEIFYEDRFLESWAGPIVTNPSTAIVELVVRLLAELTLSV
jgi:hypothetical protein